MRRGQWRFSFAEVLQSQLHAYSQLVAVKTVQCSLQFTVYSLQCEVTVLTLTPHSLTRYTTSLGAGAQAEQEGTGAGAVTV